MTIAMAMANCAVVNVKERVKLLRNVQIVKEADVNFSNDDRKAT